MTKMIEITPNSGLTTLINLFVVEPNNQNKLIETLKEGTETLLSKQPGYVSGSIHKGMDGHHVVVYSQWGSPQAIEAFQKNPEVGAYFKRVRAIAQFEPIIYDVSYVHHI